jgi:hypothetical protein
LALPWSRAIGGGEDAEIHSYTVRRLARNAGLGLLALAVTAGTWAIAAPARGSGQPLVAVAGFERASGVARFRALGAFDALAGVTLVVDGIALATDARPGESVAELLRAAGIELSTGDRLSVPADQPLVGGLRIVVDRGFPVTVVDGGSTISFRAQPGTVAAFLDRAGISVGPLDRLEVAAEGPMVPGAIVGIERVTESTIVETITVAAPVETIAEPDQYAGWRSVAVAGAPGESRVTFLVRRVNGVETSRTIVASEALSAPVAQVVHVGTKYKPAPPPPGEIASIIRDAAAKHGVEPEQLLRIAYCESRYDPLAYNGILGASGLFQIIPGTWRANSTPAGYSGASVWDPVANANVAAWMISRGGAGQWACK